MKTESIISILQILKQNEKETKERYETKKMELETKYHTEWLTSELSCEENNLMRELKSKRDTAKTSLDAFRNHEW